MLRILYVAPDTKESRITEDQQRLLRDIGAMGVSYLPLVGTVTVDDVVTTLRGGNYDVALFMAHSFGTGIQLSPGEVLEPAMLGSVARYGLRLVVLLACESYGIAQTVAEAANVDVVATVLPLESGEAWRTGAQLVQSLVNGASYREAYDEAKPANNRDFIFVAAQRNRDFDSNLTGLVARHGATLDEHGRRIDAHDAKIEEIKRIHQSDFDVLKNRGVLNVRMPIEAFIAVGMAIMAVGMLVLLVMYLAGR